MLAIKNCDIANEPSKFSRTMFGDLGRQGLFFILEINEFNFDKFVVVQSLIDGLKNHLGDAIFANQDDGLKIMSEATEVFALGSFEFRHVALSNQIK